MIYNIVDNNPTFSTVDFHTYCAWALLPSLNCNPPDNVVEDPADHYNCNRCGNDKLYCQPVLPSDILKFNFHEPDRVDGSDSVFPTAGWKGITDPYLCSATLICCVDNSEIGVEEVASSGYWEGSVTWDAKTKQFNQNFFIDAMHIAELLNEIGCDGCCFFFRFDFYNRDQIITKTVYSEQFCLSGCYELKPPDPDPMLHQCCFFLTKVQFTTFTNTNPFEIGWEDGFESHSVPITTVGLTIPEKQAAWAAALAAEGVYVTFNFDIGHSGWDICFYSYTEITNIEVNHHSMNEVTTCRDLPEQEIFKCCFLLDDTSMFPFTGNFTIDTTAGIYTVAVVGVANEDILFQFIMPDGGIFTGTAIVGVEFNTDTNVACVYTINSTTNFISIGAHKLPIVSCNNLADIAVISPGGKEAEAETGEVCFPTQCEPTLLLEGKYEVLDCYGNNYQALDAGVGNNYNPFSLLTRLYAKLTFVGFEYEFTRDEQGNVIEETQRETWRLLGSPIPLYVARIVGNILGAGTILVDGVEFEMNQTSFLKQIEYSNMWRLDVKLKTKNCQLSFGCK